MSIPYSLLPSPSAPQGNMHQKEEEAPLRSHVDGSDDSEEDVESLRYTPTTRVSRLAGGFCRYTAWGLALLILVCISAWAGVLLSSRYYLDLNQQCAEHTSHWSPVLRDVRIKYSTQHFDGRFIKENIYRGNASAEVDKAWEALGVDYRPGIISYEDGLAAGLDPSFVQRSEEFGRGFIVNVEGMHHLHCLNLLRKSLYFNYDYYKALGHHAFENEDKILRLHVTHCLDTIRQVLMCNVDTGVLGQVWTNPEDPTAFPDFNTRHTCKNYDDVRKFAERIQAPPNDELPPGYIVDPKDEDILPFTP